MTDSNEDHALISAVWAERPDLVEAALSKGANINARDDDKTVLMWAAMSGCDEIARILVTGGANVDEQTGDGSSALMMAAFSGYEGIVDLLLSRGARPDLRDQDGETALMSAAKSGEAGIIRLLIGAGADVNARDEAGLNAMMWAVSGGDYGDVVNLLIRSGVDLEAAAVDGSTALTRAESMQHVESIDALTRAASQKTHD